MTLSGRPLADNVMDAALFVGREAELSTIDAALRQELNVCVAGSPGIGTTSLLRMLMYRLRARPGVGGVGGAGGTSGVGGADDEWGGVHYVRAEGASTGEEVLARIATDVLGRAHVRDALPVETFANLRRHRQELATAHRAKGSTGAGRLHAVVIIDDLPSAAGYDLFSRHRDELWTSGYRWVVAAQREHSGLLRPPADAFFERVVELGPLTHADAVDLIERRQLWPSGWPEQVAAAVGGHPRQLLSTAREYAERPGALEAAMTATGQRDAAIARLGRPAAMLAVELASLGCASASDDELLHRLGWTRARATQVLTLLDHADLVRSEARKLAHGRPKKVFRLVTPEEYRPGH
jgi:hypothetical protein